MVFVDKVSFDDFEEIYPFLLELGHAEKTPETWQRLFTQNWDYQGGHCGYKMVADGELVGFYGIFKSEREIAGEIQKFCDINSIYIKNDFIELAPEFLSHALTEGNFNFTCYHPAKKYHEALRLLGFDTLEKGHCIIFPLPRIKWNRKIKILFDDILIRERLNDNSAIIYDEHEAFEPIYILIEKEDRSCFVVANKSKHRGLLFLSLNYIEDSGLFFEAIPEVSSSICFEYKVPAMLVDHRFSQESGIKNCLKHKMASPKFYKALPGTVKNDFDDLYTGLTVLSPSL